MSQFEAGIATVDVTPPVGVWMAGFAARNQPSQSVHDSLRSRVIALSDGRTRLIIVTNDLISHVYETIDDIKERIESEYDIPPEQVMINCSHTHSGPATREASGFWAHNNHYMQVYKQKITGAVKMALADLSPARIGAGRTDVQIGINRRERLPDGGTKLGRNPDRPVAPYVDVFRIDGTDGAARCIFFAHACHPVTRGADNYQISADYPGRAQAVVETVFEGAQAAFGQGCSGNINSDPVGGTFADVERLGTILGGATIKAAAEIETSDEIELGAAFEQARLPLQDPPPVEEAQQHVDTARDDLAEAEESSDDVQIKRATNELNWAEKLLKLAKQRATDRTIRYDMQAFAISDRAIVGLPGEVFVEYQLQIAERSPFARTVVLGVTNGCPSYVPTAEEFQYGGYEVDGAIRHYGDTMLSPDCEQVILDTAGELLERLA